VERVFYIIWGRGDGFLQGLNAVSFGRLGQDDYRAGQVTFHLKRAQ